MDDLLKDYKDYYRVRYERYKDNPDYPHTANTERQMHEAMESCAELREFKEKLGDLNEQNAVSLVKDQEKMRMTFYNEIQETIRALGPQRILEKAAGLGNAQDIISVSIEEGNKNSIEISMDESVREFQDWKLLEKNEVYSNAEIPSKWRSDYDAAAADARERLKETYNDLEKNNHSWEPNWKLDLELNWEARHRRLMPHTDETIRRRMDEAKQITGR